MPDDLREEAHDESHAVIGRRFGDAVQAARALAPRLMAAAEASDVDGGFPAVEMGWLREAGLLAAPLPKALGGAGLCEPERLLDLLLTLKHIGRGNLSVGRLYEGHVNALQLIEANGTPEQAEAAAADATGGALFGIWNTQEADGLKLAAGTGGRLKLAGSKTFASGAGHVSRALVTAQRPDGRWQMVLIPTDEQPPRIDRSFWRPLGMRATASFRVDLTGTEVPADAAIGEPDAYYREPAFTGGSVRFVAVQMGGAEAVFDETRRFLRELGRTGDPHQQVRLGEMAALVETGRLWCMGLAYRGTALDVEGLATIGQAAAAARSETTAYAQLMRASVEGSCLRVLQLAERCVGARGFLKPEPFERLHRDLTHFLRQPAPDAALARAGEFVLSSLLGAEALWRYPRPGPQS